jgi:3-deoxy-D-manno-octulosonate 8-phosphate phosphatase (KDO 8-P phosphatase)
LVAASRGGAAGLGSGPAPGRSPALTFAPELLLAARGPGEGIAAAVFDVDGVLTDGRIYIGEQGETFKAFSTLDGHGLKLLAQGGIVPIVVTGRDSPAVRRRVADLGLVHAAYGAADKLAASEALLASLGFAWNRVAVIGDDWPDLPLMRRAAFACAPPGAHVEVQLRRITSPRRRPATARRASSATFFRCRRPLREPAARPALARWHSLTTRSWPPASRTTIRSICPLPVPSRWCRPRPGTCACSISSRPTCRWR